MLVENRRTYICTYETKQVFTIKLNRELSTKLIQINSSPLIVHESQFSNKQKFHIAPKLKQTLRTEAFVNDRCNVITINNIICLMIYIVRHRALQHLLCNNAPPQITKPPHCSRFPIISFHENCAVYALTWKITYAKQATVRFACRITEETH